MSRRSGIRRSPRDHLAYACGGCGRRVATGPFSQFPRVGEITPTEIGNVREELVTDADVATWYERTGARPRRAPRATITAWWFGCRCGWFRRVTLHQLQQAHDQPVTDVERWQTITL